MSSGSAADESPLRLNADATSRGRRDSYRQLARRVGRHALAPRRSASRSPAPSAESRTPAATAEAPPDVPAPTSPGFWTADIQIRCFGRFEVSRDGVVVDRWRRRSAERLLKFLLVNGHSVPRDVLLDVLWPDVPFESSVRGLRVTLHALRRAVGSQAAERSGNALVRTDGDTYWLNTDAVWIDATAFTQHYYAGLRCERHGDVEAAIREYAAAEELYRDDFLIEDLYEEWTVLRREELKDQYLLVLTKLSQFCLAAFDLEGCIKRSHALLGKEPCREDAYQRLMQCYARLGQRGRAQRWYEICERTLRQELEVDPSDETRRLFNQISAAAL